MASGNPRSNLIFDIGMHMGEDTAYYLARGYDVVAVEADPHLAEIAMKAFSESLKTGKLVILNVAMSNSNDEEIDFYLAEKTEWNSLEKRLADRRRLWRATIRIKTRTVRSLIEQFALPHYCKIDVEGYDKICLDSLLGLEERPEYISVETECVGEFETLREVQALATLDSLQALGYRGFKLVDQSTLTVLEPGIRFYAKDGSRLLESRPILESRLGYRFPRSSSGPFGPDLAGYWLDYEVAKETLLRHRRDYFGSKSSVNYGFWCDLHATKDHWPGTR